MLSFPVNCLVPEPPLHLAQQAAAVQQGPVARTLASDGPGLSCTGRAVLEPQSSGQCGLRLLCTGKIALSLSVWH